jgi:hypothetical protein
MVFDPTTSKDYEVCRPVVFRDSGSGTPRNPENLTELSCAAFRYFHTGGNGTPRPKIVGKVVFIDFVDPAR